MKILSILIGLLFVLTACGVNEEPITYPAEPLPDLTYSPEPLVVPTYEGVVYREDLNIDNPIIYFNIIVESGCLPGFVEDNNAYYCGYDDTIYFGNMLLQFGEEVEVFVLLHEDGHSEDPYFGNPNIPTFYSEQFADCYAGYELQEHGYTDSPQPAIDFLRIIGGSPDHGTAEQRVAAFEYGYLGGNCLNVFP